MKVCHNVLIGAMFSASFALMAVPAGAATTDKANTHMSTRGAANSNGPGATDRDTGLARAEDRMSAQGRAHSRALKKKHISDSDDKTSTTTKTHY